MDQSLIDKIKELTGKTNDEVVEFLGTRTLDQMYNLIDANRKGDSIVIMPLISTLMDKDAPAKEPQPEVKEAMKKPNTKITVDLPKPRDPMAKELTKGQYQPKTTPNKKEQLARMDRKYRSNRVDDSIATSEPVVEGVLGMSSMPYIKKMLTLAGRPAEEQDIKKAMEDFMGDFGNYSGLRTQDATPTTISAIAAGPLDSIMADFPDLDQDQDAFDAELDAMDVAQDVAEPEEFDARVVATALTSTPNTKSSIDTVRSAFLDINNNIRDIKVSEFTEVRQLLSDLMSSLDRIGNNITGK